jgi:hypothetical protein
MLREAGPNGKGKRIIMAGFFKKAGDSAAKTVKSTVNWKGITGGWRMLGRAAKQIDPRELRNRPARVETFQSAYKRLNLTEKDLAANYQGLFLRFWIAAIFAMGGVALLALYCLNGRFGALLPGLGFLAICAGQMFVASFRSFQIRHRALTPPTLWAKHPEQWAPMGWSLPAAPKAKTMSEGVASAMERELRRQRRAERESNED